MKISHLIFPLLPVCRSVIFTLTGLTTVREMEKSGREKGDDGQARSDWN